MVVCKFGGAVLADPLGFRQMASILRDLSPEPVLVVVSALGHTTRLLDTLIDQTRSGDAEGARSTISALEQLHAACYSPLFHNRPSMAAVEALLDERLATLRSLLSGIATTRQATPRVRDRVLSWGEDVARELAVRWLVDQGLPATSVPARTVIVTTSEHGAAQPRLEATHRHAHEIIEPILASGSIVVIDGFVGQSETGDITTMGRESSNLTATLIGAALSASMITVYTDVEGVRSADPHVIAHTIVRPHLSYAEARTAAEAGVKLLYPTMMEPAERAGIPVRIASASNPHGASTVIDSHSGNAQPMVIGVEDIPGVTRCTSLYVDGLAWMQTAHNLLSSFHDLPWFDVTIDHAMRRADILVPSMHAVRLIDLLHSHLCLHESSHEASP